MADEFIDPLNDPRFPDRPQTQDFWRLSEAVIWLDSQVTEGGRSVTDVIGEHVDAQSAVYLAQNRLLFMLGPVAASDPHLTTLYVDALLIGMRFAELGGHRPG